MHFKIFSKHRHLYSIAPQKIFSIHMEEKNIAGKMSFYLIIEMWFCLFIAILLVKIARLTRALESKAN